MYRLASHTNEHYQNTECRECTHLQPTVVSLPIIVIDVINVEKKIEAMM